MSISVTKRSEDYAKWYTDVVLKAEMAEYGPVKGTMIIRPYGYAIWERIRDIADNFFKETGHVNAYFPMFIPESYMKREAEHVEGFAPECAIVTIGGGKPLEEPLYIRPTSETIIWASYKKWIRSYRDLPILINQWANIVRWEMRTRLFLRTTEFLWQEGHTAHATAAEAEEEAMRILEIYRQISEDYLAMPVLVGRKTESQKFAGAVHTYAIEAMMGDKKALQAGTSHYLGQNFAKAFDVTFLNKSNQLEYVYATSWGVSTRLIGGLIMAHGDDKGLILPPRVAPYQVVIVPIWKSDAEKSQINELVSKLTAGLKSEQIRFHYDHREQETPGWKFNQYEMKGVPIRLEVGPKDVAKNQVVLVRRDPTNDESAGRKQFIPADNAPAIIKNMLEEIQTNLFQRAHDFRDKNTLNAENYDQFKELIEAGSFIRVFWAGNGADEARIQEETKATIRVIPFEQKEKGTCFYTGKPADQIVIFARAY
ncbi:MAG: proline--tRNA ligase [Candidatus Marinimicrobia bacterium]|nr:proline--tRNA ligase [Candidatus Neomarinimicrobiota bacterium]